jgi:pentatricopeptide repeat protein
MSKGQLLTWTTYDTLLLALFMDGRVDEAESVWNTIIETHTRSVPKKLFSRMIQIYNTCHLPDKVLEVRFDMFICYCLNLVIRTIGILHRIC